MKISYEGDINLASRFLQRAQQEFRVLHPASGRGQLTRTFESPEGKATVWFTYGDGRDHIHISAVGAAEVKEGMWSFLSGAVIGEYISPIFTNDSGKLSDGKLKMYAPTDVSAERFGYTASPIVSSRLNVLPHETMPRRVRGSLLGEDSQYTTQHPSKYTGKMCRLVQLILSYGRLSKDTVISKAIRGFRDSEGLPLPKTPSVIWTKENVAKGVQNTFQWGWEKTHGIYTHAYSDEAGAHKEYWIIEISTTGLRAMPLQIEPVTATQQFRAYIVAEVEKPVHEKYFDDVLLILNEFGGFPSNEAFETKEAAIRAQIVTLADTGLIAWYDSSRSVSPDHGWAFNDSGVRANNICLRVFENNSWHMAYHGELLFGWDAVYARPKAEFGLAGSGAAPIEKGRLKVGITAENECVSYNIALQDQGSYTTRPKARNTPMFVFWKNDRLIVLRWSDGHTGNSNGVKESEHSKMHNKVEQWYGVTGTPPGFFCSLLDPIVGIEGVHTKDEDTTYVANEQYREIVSSPATDIPQWYNRYFWTWTDIRQEKWSGGGTDDSCVYLPLGDRSAIYFVTMSTKPNYWDTRSVTHSYIADPYAYSMTDSYIWNWDFGTLIGHPFPVTHGGVTLDGVYPVVWDRAGSKGKMQIQHYGVGYIWGPAAYAGGYGHNLTPEKQKALDEWTALTGRAEWADIGYEPTNADLVHHEFAGAAGPTYSHYTPGETTLEIHLVSLQKTGNLYSTKGSFSSIYEQFHWLFKKSPEDGNYLSMHAFKNCFGPRRYQLYEEFVNAGILKAHVAEPYYLPRNTFPTFIGVVGTIPPYY